MDVPLARRRGTQVAHSLNMIAELPAYVDDRAIPAALRAAAIDAFFIHMRLLIEFLIKPDDDRAICRRDYVKGFSLEQGLRTRLSADYDFASRHVAHLNYERVPAEDSPIFEPVDGDSLGRHADDVFAAMSAFAQHLSATGSEYAGDFGGWLALAKNRRLGPATTGGAPLSGLGQDDVMADRYRTPGGWTIEVVQLAEGERLRIRHHGFYVADVRSVADLERWVPQDEPGRLRRRYVNPRAGGG
jgi:hypothetical protein